MSLRYLAGMRPVAALALVLVVYAAPATAAPSETSLIQRASAAVGLKATARLANLMGRQDAGIAHYGIDNLPLPSRRHLLVRQLVAVLGAFRHLLGDHSHLAQTIFKIVKVPVLGGMSLHAVCPAKVYENSWLPPAPASE
jgi:hypothetical protein